MTPLCETSTDTHSCRLPDLHSGSHHWAPTSPHNHLTRDVKPRGKCRGCDDYWDRVDASTGAVLVSS